MANINKGKKMKFYSQYNQDKWLYDTFFTNKYNGVFLEIGADDGVDKSNTLFFEEYLSWTGICIEPSPNRFKLLAENRACICENIAVSNFKGEVEFLDISGWGKGLSGIVGDYDARHVNRINQELRHAQNMGSKKIKVETDTLGNILEKNKIQNVDFCTIDTEGSEYKILEKFDFERFEIDIFLIENNYGDRYVRNLLESNGYKYFKRVEIDDVYIRQDVLDKL
jgi:FkbM family methyltransferase